MRIHQTNKEIFLNENAVSYYLLGAYMTDGNVCTTPKFKNFSISSKDGDWLDLIRALISPTKKLQIRADHFRLKIFDLEIIDWLISYGCVPNKSLTLKMEKSIPEKYIKDFIRGVVDGDGSISVCNYNKIINHKIHTYKKVNAYICSASYEFINQLFNILNSKFKCGLIRLTPSKKPCYIKGKKVISKNPIWRIYFNDSNAKKFLSWIYSNAEISLPRKAKLVSEILAG